MITSALLNRIPGIAHGFGTAHALVPEALQAVWALRPNKKQVHGTSAIHITGARHDAGLADAFYTDVAGIPVSIITADCVPLLLARADGALVAAVHAGWRGLHGGIIVELVAELRGRGEDMAGWIAAIGPTICAPCYEISEELAADFVQRFSDMPAATLFPQQRHPDLRAIAEHQLRGAGVVQIEHVGGCTCCARDAAGQFIYRSYRRGDRNSQMHAGLYIIPKEST